MSDYLNTVKMEADIERSRIDFATITQFTGRMLPMKAVVEFSGTASGTVADMRGRIERLATRGAVIRGADFRMQGLPDVRTTRFSLIFPTLKPRPATFTTYTKISRADVWPTLLSFRA